MVMDVYRISFKRKKTDYFAFNLLLIFLSSLLVPIEENSNKSFIKSAQSLLQGNTVRQTVS